MRYNPIILSTAHGNKGAIEPMNPTIARMIDNTSNNRYRIIIGMKINNKMIISYLVIYDIDTIHREP